MRWGTVVAPPLGGDGPPPRVTTDIATTDVTVTDTELTEPIHHQLAARDLLPAERCLDSGYPSAEPVLGMRQMFGVTMVTSVLLNGSPQAHAGAGFDRKAFTIARGKRHTDRPARRSRTANPG